MIKKYDTFGSKSMHKRLATQLDLAKKPPKESPTAEPVFPHFQNKTAVLIATGPSLTQQQLDLVRQKQKTDGVVTFGINNVYQSYPWLDVFLSCDGPWWRWYWNDPELREMSKTTSMFTWYNEFAEEFGINYIKAIVRDGVSLDPSVVHINHGSGPMMMNLALHYGVTKMVLIGHDMKFASDYDGRKQFVGSKPRHYFGEYPKPLQHWPSVKVRQGVLDGLIEAYIKIEKQFATDPRLSSVDIVNCTEDTALTMFRRGDLEKEI